jgi:hypothetical protein
MAWERESGWGKNVFLTGNREGAVEAKGSKVAKHK